MPQQFRSYHEFFAFYLEQHSHPANRILHVCGTVLGIATVVAALAIGRPWLALLWVPIAYGFAWAGHFLIEGNKPASFGHPLWSFVSDFRMMAMIVTGKLPITRSTGAANPPRAARSSE